MTANSANDPLAALANIHLPAEPGLWPPAPGWWLLALVVVILLTSLVIWFYHRKKLRAPLVTALQEVDQLNKLLSGSILVQQLNQLLRRAARIQHGDAAAALAPQAWAEFLHQHAPADLAADHDSQVWQQLAHAAYQPLEIERSGEIVALTRAWLRSNLPC